MNISKVGRKDFELGSQAFLHVCPMDNGLPGRFEILSFKNRSFNFNSFVRRLKNIQAFPILNRNNLLFKSGANRPAFKI